MDLRVDDRALSAEPGETLLDALRRAGIEVPSPCYHPALGPLETCDTCMVEVNGEVKRACATRVDGPLSVRVRGEALEALRGEAYARILGRHELYCTVCDYNDGGCEVKRSGELLQVQHQKYPFRKKRGEVDDSNPFYRYDPDQCILCGRCVEACQNVQVTETLSIDWTEESPVVLWDGGRRAGESSCVSCGHCVTVCPCNALMEKSMLGRAGNITWMPEALHRASIQAVKKVEPLTSFAPLFAISDLDVKLRNRRNEVTKTVCTYCGVGCSFDVHHRGGAILKVDPPPEAPANGISTCVKGKFGWAYTESGDRLPGPLLRRGEQLVPASWDDALDEVAERLRAIVKAHGKDSIGFISSSKITNEECYLVQKIARSIFGTNNVDNCARYCQSPASKALSRTVGFGADSGTMNDIDQADLVLVVGSNTATSHPVLASRIKRRKKRGEDLQLIVADLREHELARWADLYLQPRPSTDLFWLNTLARIIVDEGLEDRAFIEARVNGYDEYVRSLEPFTVARAVEVTGLPEETLRDVARRIAKAEKVCGLWAMGLTQHVDGADACTAYANLLLLTGNYGRPGTGAYPLRGHNNVQGACDFGALTQYLPGYQGVEDAEARARYEKAWGGAPIPCERGLDNTTMIEAAHEGRLKALFVVGEELRLVDANVQRVEKALKNLEFLAVQDIFMSRTAELADVVLAGAPSFEKDGTFVNTERRIQRLYEVFPPRQDSRADWRILQDLAAHLGHDWSYAHPSDIMEEIARLTPIFAGVRYDRLEGYASLCWPVAEDGTDTPVLYTERFPFPDGRARFHPVEWREPSEQADPAYPLHLDNGRVLEHFHEGNMTFRVEGLASITRAAYVEIPSALARAEGLEEGDVVTLTSRRGTCTVPVLVSDELPDGTLYMSLHTRDPEGQVNRLTSSRKDPDVHTPAYKEVAVRLERAPEDARGRVLPVTERHPRNGAPTPRPGVEVEKKRARFDQVPLDETWPDEGRV